MSCSLHDIAIISVGGSKLGGDLGMDAELTFRKLFEGEDFYTYFWK
ncbi:MAG: hypothetical protein HPY75_05515, partial [Actinobacteria bacterium]|nr:hypothetical protein [Actinomycetota bacterium]